MQRGLSPVERRAEGFVAVYPRRLPTQVEKIAYMGDFVKDEMAMSLKTFAWFEGKEYRPVYRKWGVEHA